MRLSTHVSEDLAQRSIDRVCAHCSIVFSILASPSSTHILQSCAPHCRVLVWGLSGTVIDMSLQRGSVLLSAIYPSEYNHVLRVLALTNYYRTNHCSVETAKVVVFLRTLQQENDVVSHLRDLFFRQMLAVITYVILHKLYNLSEPWDVQFVTVIGIQ